MKLLTIDCREIGGRPGVLLDGDEILDLAAAPSTLDQAQWIPYSIVSVLAAGRDGLERVAALVAAAEEKNDDDRDALRREGVLVPADATALLPPVRRPGLVLVDRADGSAYIKSPNAAVGSGTSVEAPWHDDAPLECTGMLSVALGKSLYRASEQAAADAIVGYTLMLDLVAESRQFPGSGPMGPAIVTVDEYDGASTLQLALNEVVVATEDAGQFTGNAAARIAQLSQHYGFRPGDVVGFEPPAQSALNGCRLHAGDAVRLSLDGVMSLDVAIAKG